jgi:hypothetical protein
MIATNPNTNDSNTRNTKQFNSIEELIDRMKKFGLLFD